MTARDLAQSYLFKAETRLKVLALLFAEEDFSDVVREAQEIVELALKGMLRSAGVEPPKHHDVGGLLVAHANRFTTPLSDLERLREISKRLRKERELAFYGDIDFVPTEEYSEAEATSAISDATFAVDAARRVIPAVSPI